MRFLYAISVCVGLMMQVADAQFEFPDFVRHELDSGSSVSGDGFGESIASDPANGRLAICSTGGLAQGFSDPNKFISIWERADDGTWAEQAVFTATLPESPGGLQFFGHACAMLGNEAFVGEFVFTSEGLLNQMRHFVRDEQTGTWSEATPLPIAVVSPPVSASMSEGRLVVACMPPNSSKGTYPIQHFTQDSSGAWSAATPISVSMDTSDGDPMHVIALALDGNTLVAGLVAGAIRFPIAAEKSSFVILYRSGPDTWDEEFVLPQVDAGIGIHVAIDGSRAMAAGMTLDSFGSITDGGVIALELSEISGNWGLLMSNSETTADVPGYGLCCDLRGTQAIVGSSDAVYVYGPQGTALTGSFWSERGVVEIESSSFTDTYRVALGIGWVYGSLLEAPSSSGTGVVLDTSGCPPDAIPGDMDGDGDVDADDLALLQAQLGMCVGDINGDGAVDGADLTFLLGAWGVCP